MRRHVLRVSVFVGILAIGWIAIAQAQRQSDEVTILPPPRTAQTIETAEPQGNLARQNPLRNSGQVVASVQPKAPAMASSSQSVGSPIASDPFWASSIPSATEQREPVPAYGVESADPRSGEEAPIRMTAYGADMPEATVAPELTAPQDQGFPAANEYGAPTMTPPQPGLAGDAADPSAFPFPQGNGVSQGNDPNQSQDYGYAQPVEPAYESARTPAELNERPMEPVPNEPLESYGPPQEVNPAAYAPDSQGYAAVEPARLQDPGGEQRLAPINNGGNNYNTADNYNNAYASGRTSQNVAPQDNRYPTIDPVGSAPIESKGPMGTGQPARDESWDGEQVPQLRVVKIAPKEIQVGKPAVFRVEIENVGRVMAHGVEVRDQIPQSTRLIDTKPESVVDSQGGLVWQLGQMKPGDKTSVEMELMPTAEGNEIGSVAMVRFGTPASVRTVATRPMLEVEIDMEDKVMVESEATLTIHISNPGSGVATGVVLEERIPQGLQHPAGAELEYEVGNLAPKESKTIQLKLAAVRPGATRNVLIARADGLQDVVRESDLEVVAPALEIAMNGPSARYLNRKVSYEVSVSNPGSAAARDVRLIATLPPGLKFVEANNNGYYDANSRTVQWALAELPVNETGTVQLTALPVEMGNHAVEIQGTADRAVAVKQKQNITVDGIAALRFEVVDVNDPIEVGAETAYEIRVLNQGTKDASNVALQVTLPPGLELIDAEGPGSLRHSMQGGQLAFEPIRRLAPKVDTSFRVRVRGRQAGDHRLRVELNADDLGAPVMKEESTRVYGDPK